MTWHTVHPSLFTKKPPAGEFRARCRLGRWVPFDELLEIDPDTTTSRWDKKLKAHVFEVRCDFETTDRESYTEHMTTLHVDRLSRWDSPSLDPRNADRYVRTYRARMPLPVKLWKGPRLRDQGTTWPNDDERTRTCPGCGLVAEVTSDKHERTLWWAEHRRGCALLEAS